MIKPFSRKSMWLAILVVLVMAVPFIGGCAANEPPVISSLTLSAGGEITTGVSCLATCVASDPNEDELSYSWSAVDDAGNLVGRFSGEGALITWTAPDEAGSYTISVTVSDGSDGTATKQLIVNVSIPNHPPTIESLKEEWHRLKKASNTPITCVASDPDGDTLTYEWSVVDDSGTPAGNITGEGSVITWIATNNYGTYTVTVTVSDGRGGEASSSVNIIVCSCSSAH